MRNKLLWAIVAFAGIGIAAPSVSAAPILPSTWYTFCFTGPGSSLGAINGCTLGINPPDSNPVVGAPVTPWTITTVGSTILRVLDGFLSVDQFDIDDFATDLGNTSVPTPGSVCNADITCAFDNLAFSCRDYLLAPGLHSFTGTQILGTAGAGFLEVISAPAQVPEPASLALLAVAMTGLGMIRLRRGRTRPAIHVQSAARTFT